MSRWLWWPRKLLPWKQLQTAQFKQWPSVEGLELASRKTEAVLISSRRAVESAHIQIGGSTTASQRAIRYLGVMLDTGLSYRTFKVRK